MKMLFDATCLPILEKFIRDNALLIHNPIHNIEEEKKSADDATIYNQPRKIAAKLKNENETAVILQHLWKKYQIKKRMQYNRYNEYLSYVNPQDEQQVLSALMFGKRVTGINSSDPADYKNKVEGADRTESSYHRFMGNALKKLYSIENENFYNEIVQACGVDGNVIWPSDYDLIAVNLLETTPVEAFMKKQEPQVDYKLYKSPNHRVGIVALPLNQWPKENQSKKAEHVFHQLAAVGLTATQWNLATMISKIAKKLPKTQPIPSFSDPQKALIVLLQRLNDVAADKQYPTHKLAASLKRLLERYPFNLTPDALARICLVLEITTFFYKKNYPQFSLCVYDVIHELSLSFQQIPPDDPKLVDLFQVFKEESIMTLKKILQVDEANDDLNQIDFLSLPAISGTHAYAIAMKIASKMKLDSERTPKIYVQKPLYFEFQNVIKPDANTAGEADICVLSTSFMAASTEGEPQMHAGTDINAFIKKHYLGTIKPVTLIVDTTTTDYSLIKLDDETKNLVLEGKVTILFFESRQKFGLLHSDQARFGRCFGIYSKKSFLCEKDNPASNNLFEIENNGFEDYKKHLDMRIGAYICSSCGDLLEQVKGQHFSNGALFRSAPLPDLAPLVSEDDSLSRINNYFVTLLKTARMSNALKYTFSYKESFGHFNSSYSHTISEIISRLSPGASDNIDSLLEIGSLYISYYIKDIYSPENELTHDPILVDPITLFQSKINQLFPSADETQWPPLPLDQQILFLSFARSLRPFVGYYLIPREIRKGFCEATEKLLRHCPDLNGRNDYQKLYRYQCTYNPQDEISKVAGLLVAKESKIALNILLSHWSPSTIFDTFKQKTLLQIAMEADPQSVFSMYFQSSEALILQYMKTKQEAKACELMEANGWDLTKEICQDLNKGSNKKLLMKWALEFECKQFIFQQIKKLLKLGKEEEAISCFNDAQETRLNKISLFDTQEDENLLDFARHQLPLGLFVTHFEAKNKLFSNHLDGLLEKDQREAIEFFEKEKKWLPVVPIIQYLMFCFNLPEEQGIFYKYLTQEIVPLLTLSILSGKEMEVVDIVNTNNLSYNTMFGAKTLLQCAQVARMTPLIDFLIKANIEDLLKKEDATAFLNFLTENEKYITLFDNLGQRPLCEQAQEKGFVFDANFLSEQQKIYHSKLVLQDNGLSRLGIFSFSSIDDAEKKDTPANKL